MSESKDSLKNVIIQKEIIQEQLQEKEKERQTEDVLNMMYCMMAFLTVFNRVVIQRYRWRKMVYDMVKFQSMNDRARDYHIIFMYGSSLVFVR